MRELNAVVKGKTIKLFLEGDTYNEIVKKLGISKGSVVAIIEDFGEGRLQLPDSMTGLVDSQQVRSGHKSRMQWGARLSFLLGTLAL